MKQITTTSVAALATILVTCAFPAPARAQSNPNDTATAQVLFSDARALMAKGRYAEACPKLEESVRLSQGVGAQFNLGDCYERIGRSASAWSAFTSAAAAASRAGQAERSSAARQRADRLAPTLLRITVEVPEAVAKIPGFEVTRNGQTLGSAQWGTAMPVDPGKYTIAATATERERWEKTVELGPGKTKEVLRIPALAPLSSKAPAAVNDAPSPQPDAVARTSTLPPSRESTTTQVASSSPWRTVGLVTGVVGVVGLGVGSFFGLKALAKQKEADEPDGGKSHCVNGACDDEGLALRQEGMRAGNVSTVAFIAGGVLVAGGVVLYLSAPRADATDGLKVGLAPAIGSGAIGWSLRGTW